MYIISFVKSFNHLKVREHWVEVVKGYKKKEESS